MIGMYLHHQGAGHRMRGTLLAAAVSGYVTGLGSGPAPRKWPGQWVELPRDDDPGELGKPVDPDASGLLHWAPLHHSGLLRRNALITEWMCRSRPDLMVVDTSVEVSLLARLCGIPVIVAAMPGDRLDRAHRSAYDLATALLAPWPQAAADDTWPPAWAAKTRYAGGISRFEARPVPLATRSAGGKRVLVLWGKGGKDVTSHQVALAQAATPEWTWVQRGGDAPPALNLWRELCESDVVITHAGQNAVADVAAARRPAVVIAQQRPHDEQRATAAAVQRLGIAPGLNHWPEARQWPGLLAQAQSYGGQGWKAWSGLGAAGAGRWLDQQADFFAAHRLRSVH